jgi:hypothetical protein
MSVDGHDSTAAEDNPVFLSRHFSVAELAGAWNLSEDTIRRLFENEPGVMIIHHSRRRKRVYRTLRIPAEIALRVYRRLMNGAA